MAAADHTPYVGPRPFGRDEKDLFFGRDREARDLCSLVVAHPLVLLYAASGAGKSSLLNAGLIPLLEQRGYEVLPPARVGGRIPDAIKTTEVDNVYAFNVLSSWADPSVDPRQLVNVDIAGFLASRLHRKDAAGEPVLRVIFLDQFEELFTFAPERWHERAALIRQLAEALAGDSLLRVVLVMRREFVGQLETYAPLLPEGLRITRFPLEKLGPKAAQQAVEGPLARTDRRIEPEASQRLVQQLRKITVRGAGGEDVETVDQFVEPVQLQVACAKLWDDLPPDVHTITPAHIETYGDVDKTLMRFYEDALNAAATKTGVSNDRLRLWVDRYLITPRGTRGMVYRGPESTGREDNAIPNAAVDVLEEKHLIRAEARAGGERWYELTHDRFIGPIRESNRTWRENYKWRLRARKLVGAAGIVAGIVAILFFAHAVYDRYVVEYQCADRPVSELLARYSTDREGAGASAPQVLGAVATCLLSRNKLDRLAKQLQQAEPLIPAQYRADPLVGLVMPEVADDAWPIELRYNPNRMLDRGRLLYEWRVMAATLALYWGIPVPAVLKLTSDDKVSVDDLVVIAGNERTRIFVPTMPTFALVTEKGMPSQLQTWFDAHKAQWRPVDALKYGGPWWEVPRWTQPLFEAAGHRTSPREQAVALTVANKLIAQPALALNRHNVAYLLRRLEGAGFERTVAEALASRGGIDGLVDDLRAVVARSYPVVNLEYVLDSLAGYPRSQFSPAVVAEHVESDQAAATPRAGARLTGAPVPATATAIEPLAEVARAEAIVPYRDTADRISSQPPLRVYLGKDLLSYFVTPEPEWRPQIREKLNDLRGDLFKRFGVRVPDVKFDSDPVSKLAPNAFRVELLNQTSDDKDPIAVEDSRRVVEQFLDELRRQLLAWRSWWITADYLERQLAHSAQIKTWLLSRYSLTDIKSLLRHVLAPSEAELGTYNAEGVDGALRRVAPGQSLRELEWLLGSLVFWSQAGDGLDTAQLVRALQETQAARVAPNQQSLPEHPAMGVLAGIKALEQGDFPLAEERFREAVAADRSGAIATFLAAYASRDAVSTMGELNKLTQACVSFKPPGELNEPRSIEEQIRFEIEDFLARHQDSIADPDRVRLEYCLLEHYAASNYSDHMRASLKLFNTPRYSAQLEPNQKYALGYWTLELNGRSFDPSSDQAAAENWLASAFRDWKETEQEEASARDAVEELLSRYESRYDRLPPRWYMDMLQRLGERRPKNPYIAYALGIALSGGSDEADVKKALFWLERAREHIDGPAVAKADRPRLKAWIGYGVAKNYSAKARVSAGNARQEAAQEATSRLKAVTQSVKNDGFILNEEWPGVLAYDTLIDTHLFRNEIEEAARLLDDLRNDGLTERPELAITRFFILLAAGRTDEALQFAERAHEIADFNRANALWLAALSQLLTDRPEAEYAARNFFATTHILRDHIHLMLYWHLARQGKVDLAKTYLERRWRGIDRDSWRARLAQGNVQVWRERLIGYYLGSVKRDEIFAPLRSREAFASSELSRIGMSYEDIYSEAHFYDALLQAVTDDPATRSARFTQAIQRVLEVGHGGIYEYLMARYLRSRG
jgi:DNA-binding transcriptional MerR regulator